jgi:glycosyltransferase involved in cell wall biosynthesis
MSRVLFISKPIAPPFTDGTRNLVRDLARALGPEVAEVLSSRGTSLPGIRARALYAANGPTHTLGRADALRLLAHLSLAPLPPLLHWFFTPSRTTARLPAAFARLRGRRTVWTLPSAPTTPLGPAEVIGVARILVFSDETRARLLSWGIPSTQVDVMPPWLEPLGPPSTERVAATRDALAPKGTLTLFCGDLGPGRGETLTLEAFAAARTKDDRLVIAARPKGAHAETARRALVERIAALGLLDHVRMMDRVTDMPSLLAAADLVVLPATILDAKVDIPLVLLEALSLGRAVIVSEGAPPAMLARRGAAIAVPPRVEPLAEAMRALLQSAEARERLGRAGRAVVERDHAASVVARAHAALYDEVLR